MKKILDPFQQRAPKKTSDFLFVFPDRKTGGIYGGCQYYLGAAYILSYHMYPSDKVRFFLSDNTLSWAQTAQAICAEAKIGIGFTVYDSNYTYVKELASRIKKKRPNLIIACGGPSATFSPEKIMADCKAVDLCIIGEGELTFHHLYQAKYHPAFWKKIPGLVFREKKEIIHTPPQTKTCYSNQMDDAHHNIVSPYIAGILPPAAAATLGVFTSKGCQFACTYCSFAAASHRRTYFFSESMVIEELKLICQWFEKTGENVVIDIIDDNFTISINRCKRILKKMSTFRPQNVTFSFGARPDGRQDDEFYELARKAGIVEIGFGLESADTKVLSLVKKVREKKGKNYSAEAIYIDKVKKAVHKTIENGINATVSIILGLPGDTKVSAQKTLDFIKTLPVDVYYHNILNIFDGTELSLTHNDFGIKREIANNTPFLKTIHGYDTHRFPILPQALIVKTFMSIILHRFLLALSGAVNDFFRPDVPFIYIDFLNQEKIENADRFPTGSLVLLLKGIKCRTQVEQMNIAFSFLEQTRTGRKIRPGFATSQIRTPSIILPGDCINVQPGNCYIEFFAMRPEHDFPASQTNHWKLPFGACGLLKGKCPANGSKLKSNMTDKNTCIFYPLESDFSIVDCDTCECNNTCPKCPYLLKQNAKTYCDFHKSGKSGKLQSYLATHFYTLSLDRVDITHLPSINFENFEMPSQNTGVIRIDDQLSVVKW